MRPDNFRQDLAYALRGLRTKPAFTIAVVATLALGIGGNAAMFNIVDQLLFRPPPMLRDPATAHRVYVANTYREKEFINGVSRYVAFEDLKRWTTSFSSFAGYTTRRLAVGEGDNAREMLVGFVSYSFFDFFNAPPVIGRYFTAPEDTTPAGAAVAVLTYPMWRTQFGGRADVIGSTIRIGSVVYSVIGVAPRGFEGIWPGRAPAAYMPITNYGAAQQSCAGRARLWYATYQCGWMNAIARRKPSVSLDRANADITQAAVKSYVASLAEQIKSPRVELAKPRAMIAPMLAERGPNKTAIARVATWVGGVSIVVLLIACANVANLLLARAIARRREIAVRLALGVSRGRLLSQLLTESIVLALLGGVVGVVVAQIGGGALRAGFLPDSTAPAGARDPRTVFFAFAAAIVVGLLTGVAPILRARRVDVVRDLRLGAREGGQRRSAGRVALLVLQATLSVILLVGAGLFVRSLRRVEGMRLGYDVDPILVVGLNMRGETLDTSRHLDLFQRLLTTAKTTPGVVSASRQTAVPFWSNSSTHLTVAGIDTVERLGNFDYSAVGPEYFRTFGTRIVRGRGITVEDRRESPRVAVVSENMARVLWPGRDAIGQCMKVDSDVCTTVVGIAENIKEQNLAADSMFYYYMPVTQFRPRAGGLFVRVAGDAPKFSEQLRRSLQREMPGASYVTVTPFREIVAPTMRSFSLGATMFVAFGALALVVAAMGLYSVIAYNVEQRTHELGVRLALGAQPRDLARLVLTDGARVAVTGVGIGVAVALYASKWLEPLLFGVSPRDAAVYVTASVTLLLVAMLGSWMPARRASRTDPNIALRSE
ncbi:MAG TPA: ABC transporter permease [Gemmatimonadaceae bacterium]|jgi:putative ABC transport system permease protein|nr:ABC transporter permease [Gemmatimonadaceae bacterium]